MTPQQSIQADLTLSFPVDLAGSEEQLEFWDIMTIVPI
jgi:hypothetical protein